MRQGLRSAPKPPEDKGEQCNTGYDGHKDTRHLVDHTLYRCLRSLSFLYQPDNIGQSGLLTYLTRT